MGMADKQRFQRSQDAFGQVMQLAAIEQQVAAGRPNPDQQQRVIK